MELIKGNSHKRNSSSSTPGRRRAPVEGSTGAFRKIRSCSNMQYRLDADVLRANVSSGHWLDPRTEDGDSAAHESSSLYEPGHHSWLSQPESSHHSRSSQPGSSHHLRSSQPGSSHHSRSSQPGSSHHSWSSQPGSGHHSWLLQPCSSDSTHHMDAFAAAMADSRMVPLCDLRLAALAASRHPDMAPSPKLGSRSSSLASSPHRGDWRGLSLSDVGRGTGESSMAHESSIAHGKSLDSLERTSRRGGGSGRSKSTDPADRQHQITSTRYSKRFEEEQDPTSSTCPILQLKYSVSELDARLTALSHSRLNELYGTHHHLTSSASQDRLSDLSASLSSLGGSSPEHQHMPTLWEGKKHVFDAQGHVLNAPGHMFDAPGHVFDAPGECSNCTPSFVAHPDESTAGQLESSSSGNVVCAAMVAEAGLDPEGEERRSKPLRHLWHQCMAHGKGQKEASGGAWEVHPHWWPFKRSSSYNLSVSQL